MPEYTDLHCHWVAAIDDGAPTPEVGIGMLRGLAALGFTRVIATPHMRPGMFENDRDRITDAFNKMGPALELARDQDANAGSAAHLPAVDLSSEHYFDDVVYERVLSGQGLPYPGGRAVLFEFYEVDFPTHVDRLLAELKRRGVIPVIAHPERYRVLWKKPDILARLLDTGAVALLDTAAVVGKYGREPMQCALDLLERGLYHAACSDAHRVSDLKEVSQGMDRIRELYGADELEALFRLGPNDILSGQVKC